MLFKISCTTCQAKFAVHDPSLKGQIIACPKCGSMILVEPSTDESKKINQEQPVAIPPVLSTEAFSSDLRSKEFHLENDSIKIGSYSKSSDQMSVPSELLNDLPEKEISETIIDKSAGSFEESNKPATLADSTLSVQNADFPSSTNSDLTRFPPIIQQKNFDANIESNQPTSQNFESNIPPILDISNGNDLSTENSTLPFYQNRLLLVMMGIILALIILISLQLLSHQTTSVDPQFVLEDSKNDDKTPSNSIDLEQNDLGSEPNESEEIEETIIFGENDVPAITPNDSETALQEPDVEQNSDISSSETTSIPETDSVSQTETNESLPFDSSESESTIENELDSPLLNDSSADSLNSSKPTNDNNEDSDDDSTEEEIFDMTASTTETSFQNTISLKNKENQIQNIQDQLNIPIKSIIFPQNSLPDIISVLSGIMNVPISVDLSCFELIRQSVVTPVDYRVQDKNVGEILNDIADLLKLTVQNDESQFILTAPELEKTTILETTFEVKDIVSALSQNQTSNTEKEISTNPEPENLDSEASEPTLSTAENDNRSSIDSASLVHQLSAAISIEELQKMIELLIDPKSWESNGGTATIQIDKESASLIIRQTEQNRRAIEKLLEQIRGIRQLPEQTDISRENLIPELLGWEKLSEKISLNYVEPVPLADILAVIAKSQNIKILIDLFEFSKMGVRIDQLAVIHIEQGTIDQILNELLRPLHLSYVILAENLILISSAEKAENYNTIEIHLFSRPDQPEKKPLDINELCKLIASWDTSVTRSQTLETANNLFINESSPKGSIWIDETSGCLIVRQSQPVQRLLRLWLENRLNSNESTPNQP